MCPCTGAVLLAAGVTPVPAHALRPRRRLRLGGLTQAFGRVVAISGEYAFVAELHQRRWSRYRARRCGARVQAQTVTGWKEVDKIIGAEQRSGRHRVRILASPGRWHDAAGLACPAASLARSIHRLITAQPARNGRIRWAADTSHGTVFAYHRDAAGKWVARGAGCRRSVAAPPGRSSAARWSMSGNTALIGAPSDSTGGSSVHIFRRNQDGSRGRRRRCLAGAGRGAAAIALAFRSRLMAIARPVGAPGRKSKGAVFVFKRAADGSWTQETEQVALPVSAPT